MGLFRSLQGLPLAFKIKLRSLRMAEVPLLVQLRLLCQKPSFVACLSLLEPPACVSCSLESSPLSPLHLFFTEWVAAGVQCMAHSLWNVLLSLVLCPRMAWMVTCLACLAWMTALVISGVFFFFFNIYILLKFSWLTVFQVHGKVIQLYKYAYFIFEIIFHPRLLQDVDYSSLYYTINLCWLLHIYFLIRNLAF